MFTVRTPLTIQAAGRAVARRFRRSPAPALAAVAAAACVVAVLPAAAALAAPALAAACGSPVIRVSSLNDSGTGTLRWAIGQANDSGPGSCTSIDFTVSGTIVLLSALPVISTWVVVDGQSVSSYRAGDPPPVAVDFHGHPGLTFAPGSADSELIGVAIDDADGNGLTLEASGITVNGDYIGLTPGGAAAGNRGDGIYVARESSGDHIGLNPSGKPGVVGNVISANSGSGIVLLGSGRDTLVANRIGTNPAGTAAMGNGHDGILIAGHADGNEIGGTKYTNPATGAQNNPTGSKGTVTPVFVVPPLGNLISGNVADGVDITIGSRENTLNGNFIGTSASGNSALGNGRNGVWIDDASRNSLTGCKFVNNPFVYYNVISGNGADGLRITDSNDILVQGNFFGVGANNTTLLGNRRNGILVDGSSADTQVGGVIPLGNVSAGNGANGIEVTGHVHGFVTFNTFGGLLAFKGAAPNRNDGLLITSTGGDNLARTNVFSGNTRNGIELAGNATGVTVDPDIAGLSTSGRTVLANGGDGLLIDGNAHGNVIGGLRRSVIPQDTFSGNHGYGVAITGRAHGNRVFGNFIGTGILGLTRLSNRRGGVLVGGSAYANVIGDTNKVPANLISGNIGNGVTLGYGTEANWVIWNYIGLDRVGRKLPNTGKPVVNHGHNIVEDNRTS